MIDPDELVIRVELHLHDVHAGLEPALRLCEIIGGGAQDMLLLLPVDRVHPAHIGMRLSGLDLDEGDLFPVADDEVDLAELAFIILFENFALVFFQISGGVPFAQRAELFVRKMIHL